MPARLESIAASELFANRFGSAPSVVVRAPGRVNLIGEHTDYSNLPVLPMAIDMAVTVAAIATDDGLVEAWSEAFDGPAALTRDGRLRGAIQQWHAYVRGAVLAMEHMQPAAGARIAITSDLPAEGGLSSSSALTLGLLAALNEAWRCGLSRDELVSRAIEAERSVGVESGGMDQTVIAFASAGSALRIDFDPPGQREVPIPDGFVFAAAYSGEPALKGGDARDAYNDRVVGCRIAAVMLADHLGLDVRPGMVLGDVAGMDVVDILAEELPAMATPAAIAKNLKLVPSSLTSLTAGKADATAPVLVKGCAVHVLSEAGRVDRAERALLDGDLAAFGRLLDESHESLRDNHRCSTPALNDLCKAMRKAGAAGARLTGAGFGGFAIAVATPEVAERVIESAIAASGGPAFVVQPSPGMTIDG